MGIEADSRKEKWHSAMGLKLGGIPTRGEGQLHETWGWGEGKGRRLRLRA